MTLTDILEILKPIGFCSIIILIGSLIKVTPLQINIWGWLARKIGNALNHDMLDQIKIIEEQQVEIEKKLDTHINEQEAANAIHNRKSILLFANDILKGEKHTKEQFLNVLQLIDSYESYCKDHPDFPNNRCLLAIESIKENYKERLAKADFLAEQQRVTLYKNKGIEESKKSNK